MSITLSPGPQRRRWDKDNIVTDLAQEGATSSDLDDVINPKPEKIEIIRTSSFAHEVEEVI